jgi:hypothetical protein
MQEPVIVNTKCHKLLLSIQYAISCYCQYCMQETVIVNSVWRKLLLSMQCASNSYWQCMSEPVIVNIVCKKLLSQYNVPETVINNVVCQKLLLSILYAITCYCQYCIPEAVIAHMLYLFIYIQLILKNLLYLITKHFLKWNPNTLLLK